MSASSALITDITSVITTGPTGATSAKAIAAAGPIQDWSGNCRLTLLDLQEAKSLLTTVKAATDSGDSTLTTINAVLAALSGTSGPSTTLITDMGTVVTTGPSAATAAKAIAAAGPIQDWTGNCRLAQSKLQTAKRTLTVVKAATDNSDGTLTTINNLLTALA